MKKGFTLVELLAVIIILGVIALISTPIVLNVVEDAKINAGLSEANLIYNEIIKYCDTEEVHIGENYEKICTNDKIKDNVGEIVKLGNVEVLEIQYKNNLNWLKLKKGKHIFSLSNEKMIYGALETPDLSGANKPDLLDNSLVPIKYDGSKWIYADVKKEWYNYDKKEWANAVIVNKETQSKIKNGIIKFGDEINDENIDLWYVWIPRFKYQLFKIKDDNLNAPINIKIIFEENLETTGNVKCISTIGPIAKLKGISDKKEEDGLSEDCENYKVGNWYTHPAFTLGNKELSGIWVGKYENSFINNDIRILPNKNITFDLPFSDIFNKIRKISVNYGVSGNSRLIRNSEWGAIAYLAHSKYGISNRIPVNDAHYITSSNPNKSSTNNVYGIQDLSGCSEEYVSGIVSDVNNNLILGDSMLNINDVNLEEFDFYKNGNSKMEHFRGKLGDATYETIIKNDNNNGTWYNGWSSFVVASQPWFVRGGNWYMPGSSNSFSYRSGTGSIGDKATRSVFSK